MVAPFSIEGASSKPGADHHPYDNAAMESFFGTLKCELFHLNKFDTTETLKDALHDYIRYYNVDRIKIGLGGLSPVAYRMQAAAATA